MHESTEYLELFLRNLLLNENNELHNRTMHISGAFQTNEKADIRGKIEERLPDLSEKTIHILLMYGKYGNENIFGRSDVEELTGLKSTRASELLKILLNVRIIQATKGHGKGKYCFIDPKK